MVDLKIGLIFQKEIYSKSICVYCDYAPRVGSPSTRDRPVLYPIGCGARGVSTNVFEHWLGRGCWNHLFRLTMIYYERS